MSDHPTNPNAIRVKRDGPRGWHWIDASQFQPGVHVRYEEQAGQASQQGTADAQIAPPILPKKGRRK